MDCVLRQRSVKVGASGGWVDLPLCLLAAAGRDANRAQQEPAGPSATPWVFSIVHFAFTLLLGYQEVRKPAAHCGKLT